jgi:hypothetical protein
VEAKAAYKTAADAVQQARSYAKMLGLKFAYPARERLSATTVEFLSSICRVHRDRRNPA